jgi:hypothetical protein
MSGEALNQLSRFGSSLQRLSLPPTLINDIPSAISLPSLQLLTIEDDHVHVHLTRPSIDIISSMIYPLSLQSSTMIAICQAAHLMWYTLTKTGAIVYVYFYHLLVLSLSYISISIYCFYSFRHG